MGRKGQRCRVIVRGKMNSCLIEFEDSYQAVTSRNALRKYEHLEKDRIGGCLSGNAQGMAEGSVT